MRNIFWFRNDLRLSDNHGLYKVLEESNEVIPIFILDPNYFKSSDIGVSRVYFLFDCLKDLQEQLKSLNSRLVIREGNAVNVLLELAKETNSKGVYFNKSYEPYDINRDENVINKLLSSGINIKTYKDYVIFEKKEISGSKLPFKSYNHYKKKWQERLKPELYKTYFIDDKLKKRFIEKDWQIFSIKNPSPKDYNFVLENDYPKGGEKKAEEEFEYFIKNKISKFEKKKNIPSEDISSHLSPYLKFGCISPRTCLEVVMNLLQKKNNSSKRKSYEKWIENLTLRDFYIQLIFNFNEKLNENIDNREEWTNKYQLFFAWCNGQTGYPIIDASMRQLNEYSWLNHYQRYLVAMFLIKTLEINWKWGEKYFMHKLVDGDLAINNSEWQNVFTSKIKNFNITEISKKIDKKGTYIKTFLPQLYNVPEIYIHEPHKMPQSLQRKITCLIGIDYPLPIIDYSDNIENIIKIPKKKK